MHFEVCNIVFFTIFSPTYFGRYSDHLQRDAIITRTQRYKCG